MIVLLRVIAVLFVCYCGAFIGAFFDDSGGRSGINTGAYIGLTLANLAFGFFDFRLFHRGRTRRYFDDFLAVFVTVCFIFFGILLCFGAFTHPAGRDAIPLVSYCIPGPLALGAFLGYLVSKAERKSGGS